MTLQERSKVIRIYIYLKCVMCVNYVNAYAAAVQLAMGRMVRVSNPSPKLSRPVVGLTQPPSKWVPGFFLEVKHTWHEADDLPLSSAEVKNGWNSISLSHIICLHIMNGNNFSCSGVPRNFVRRGFNRFS